MSTGNDAMDKRAIELGCCGDCLAAGPDKAEHSRCVAAVMAAFGERYDDVPPDRVRHALILDGFRPYR